MASEESKRSQQQKKKPSRRQQKVAISKNVSDTVAIAAASAGIIWLWRRLSNRQWCRALWVAKRTKNVLKIKYLAKTGIIRSKKRFDELRLSKLRELFLQNVAQGNIDVLVAILEGVGEYADSIMRFQDSRGRTPLHCILEIEDRFGVRCLHLAATSGSASICKFLIEKGANINAEDQYRCTPFFYGIRAVNNGAQVSAAFLNSPANSLNLYHTDKGGNSALHIASQFGRAGAAAAVLIKTDLTEGVEGANRMLNLCNLKGHSPIDVLRESSRSYINKTTILPAFETICRYFSYANWANSWTWSPTRHIQLFKAACTSFNVNRKPGEDSGIPQGNPPDLRDLPRSRPKANIHNSTVDGRASNANSRLDGWIFSALK